MANSQPIDDVEVEAEPEPLDVDQRGPKFGPLTHNERMTSDIHERRARAL